MGILRSIGTFLVPTVVRRIAAPIILLVLLLYFYTNGPGLFGALWQAPGFSNAMNAYIFFVFGAFALAAVPRKDPLAAHIFEPVTSSLWLQALVFIGIAVLVNSLIVLSGLRVGVEVLTANLIPLILFQITVASSEELFFRGALFRAGPLISSGGFAIFHSFVYSFALAPMIFALVAGLAFYSIYAATKERFGATVNTAAHFAYNLGLLGVVLLGPILGAFFGA